VSHPLAHTKRFELRLQIQQLAQYRAMAEAQGVSVADMIRHAMDFAAEHMPDGYIKKIEAERFDALVAAFSVRTESATFGNDGETVRTGTAG
jgi:hypothetical protein